MTTELTNVTTVTTQQPLLRRLPTVSNSSKSVPQEKPDNIIHVNFVQRQNVAKSEHVSNDQSTTLAQKTHSEVDLKKPVFELNNSQQLVSRNLEFHIDSTSGKTVITVRDTETKEVIRQIPSDQFLSISGRLKELQESKMADSSAVGILFTSQT